MDQLPSARNTSSAALVASILAVAALLFIVIAETAIIATYHVPVSTTLTP